jgi:hypothetical protein
VNLIRGSKTKLLFQLGQREGRFLLRVLKLYPRVPSAHQPLSKSGRLPDSQENQRLLDEALAEQRAASKRQLQTLLNDPQQFRQVEGGFHLSLSPIEAEWLLQVLNDIRVGSWVRLGSPEERLEGLNPRTTADYWAMEMSGYFESELLEALTRET